jgi:hypothetical protein
MLDVVERPPAGPVVSRPEQVAIVAGTQAGIDALHRWRGLPGVAGVAGVAGVCIRVCICVCIRVCIRVGVRVRVGIRIGLGTVWRPLTVWVIAVEQAVPVVVRFVGAFAGIVALVLVKFGVCVLGGSCIRVSLYSCRHNGLVVVAPTAPTQDQGQGTNRGDTHGTPEVEAIVLVLPRHWGSHRSFLYK